MPTAADRLRVLLQRPGILTMPGCHDAMSARLIEEAGFELGFMSGFAVSASRLGMPDTGLISYGELVEQGRNICRTVSIPLIGDGDTGFGSAQNVKRTVQGYADAGFACIMLEDQVAPKRCGHTEGKAIVAREEALLRVRAAVDARNAGADILIMARKTPMLPPAQLATIGYTIAVYPLTLLNVSIQAMRSALQDMARGDRAAAAMDFDALKAAVGFPEYYADEARYLKP
jgi:2-methylisocitrate lyase-like PEP mutase family enzyme